MSEPNCTGEKLPAGGNGNLSNHSLVDLVSFLPSDGTQATRIAIAVVYSAVCTLGMLGNLLVFFLLGSRPRRRMSSVTCFVLNLAVTDFQFVLTLPFWAVDTALDFSWPFGKVMCKLIASVSAMNMYASVFFLTAMSVARYCSVVSSLKADQGSSSRRLAKVASAIIWLFAALATLPHAIFSTTHRVSGDELCLVKFPNQALTAWGIFIKFNLVPFTEAFYNTQAYIFPVTVCLAHTNSCLNPVLYCLVRREFREALKGLLLKPCFDAQAKKDFSTPDSSPRSLGKKKPRRE